MGTARPIRSVAEGYAHALVIEGEAIARYREFAEYLEDHGNEVTASLFRHLARMESEHAETLARKAAEVELPRLDPVQHSWLDDGPPEAVSHELIFHLMTPYDALKIALGAEQRAKEFFEHVLSASDDPDVKTLAAEMTRGEFEHIRRIENALTATPQPFTYSEDHFRHFAMH